MNEHTTYPTTFYVRGATIDETESNTGTCPECNRTLTYGDPIHIRIGSAGLVIMVRCDDCEIARLEPSMVE